MALHSSAPINWPTTGRASLLDHRPVRWLPTERAVGDYEGRERTLEVFMTGAADQLEMLRRLRPLRAGIESAIGGALIVIVHTPRETERLFPELAAQSARVRTASG